MKFAVSGVLVLALALSGCAASPNSDTSPSISPEKAATVEASSGAGIPADAPGVNRLDADGHSPQDVIEALFDATNRARWDRLYSLYATPAPDYDSAAKEWAEARERYEHTQVLEVRVASSDTAYAHVAYVVTVNRVGESPYTVDVREAGEWWPLHKVEGLWRVQWMPRQ